MQGPLKMVAQRPSLVVGLPVAGQALGQSLTQVRIQFLKTHRRKVNMKSDFIWLPHTLVLQYCSIGGALRYFFFIVLQLAVQMLYTNA